jgi:hypothetical protein
MNVQRLCRYCDTSLEQSDNPFHSKWRFTNATQISNLVLEGKADQLKEMSYHCFENGFSGIKFADPIRGINGATPAERLHLLNHSLFQLILEYNFGQKRAKAVNQAIGKMIQPKPSNFDEDGIFDTTSDSLHSEEDQTSIKVDDSKRDDDIDINQESTLTLHFLLRRFVIDLTGMQKSTEDFCKSKVLKRLVMRKEIVCCFAY